MAAPNSDTPKDPEALKTEYARLKASRDLTSDATIVAAIDQRLRQIEIDVPEVLAAPSPTEPDAEPDVEEAPAAPPTPAEALEAEKYVRQARVETMRKNTQAATAALQRAAEIAPGSPAVLEALGDDLVGRKKLKDAMKVYKRAVALDPKNVGLERKYANLVLQVESLGSLDQQMRMHLSDNPLLDSEDKIASLSTAVFLSALLPGVGHLVLGMNSRGFGILAAWLFSSVWLAFNFEDLVKFGAFASGGHTRPGLGFLLPVLIMTIIYIATLANLKSMSNAVVKRKIDRPKPPVDLPFE